MNPGNQNTAGLSRYRVWDRSVRIFHWINALCIVGLIAIGVILLNGKSLGFSAEGKILLKTAHAYIGYVFTFNLLWRLIWGFLGNRYSRWKAIMPFGKGYLNNLVSYIRGLGGGSGPHYAGHNPLARAIICFMFLLLIAQAVTGLVLAGTDLYFPPFGQQIEKWVAVSGDDQTIAISLNPGSKQGVDPVAYQEMRTFRKPFVTVHEYSFYILAFVILLHIIGVIVAELKEKNTLISAMFTGEKVFSKPPVDWVDNERQ